MGDDTWDSSNVNGTYVPPTSQQQQAPSQPQKPTATGKKPGFFSRLFGSKSVPNNVPKDDMNSEQKSIFKKGKAIATNIFLSKIGDEKAVNGNIVKFVACGNSNNFLEDEATFIALVKERNDKNSIFIATDKEGQGKGEMFRKFILSDPAQRNIIRGVSIISEGTGTPYLRGVYDVLLNNDGMLYFKLTDDFEYDKAYAGERSAYDDQNGGKRNRTRKVRRNRTRKVRRSNRKCSRRRSHKTK
jgi:hypothetical protein